MGRRLGAAPVLAAIIGSLFVATASSASASPASDFVAKTNAERRSRGISTLATSSHLASVAVEQSKRMAARGSIYHNPDLGSDVKGWLIVGENVGVGPTIDKIHDAFMDSPGHRENVLYKSYTHIGIAVYAANDRLWVTEVFAKFPVSSSTKTTTTRARSTSAGSPAVAAPAAPAAPSAPARKPVAPIREKARTVDVLERLVELG